LAGALSTTKINNGNSGGEAEWAFTKASSPYYWESTGDESEAGTRIMSKVDLRIKGIDMVFDLSEMKSPEKISDNNWRGIYFKKWKVELPAKFDDAERLSFPTAQSISLDDTQTDTRAFVDVGGMDLAFEKKYTENKPESKLSDFNHEFTLLKINMKDNSLTDSKIEGAIIIPLISETEKFTVKTPFDDNGLQTSIMTDGDLIDKAVKIGKGEERSLNLSVKQAVFDKDYLKMTIDIEWPALKLKANNINDLRIWGNRDIGFGKKDGGIGITNIPATFGVFPINAKEVKAGYKNGTYYIGFNTNVTLGDEGSTLTGGKNKKGSGGDLLAKKETKEKDANKKDINPWHIVKEVGNRITDVGVLYNENTWYIPLEIGFENSAGDVSLGGAVFHNIEDFGSGGFAVGEIPLTGVAEGGVFNFALMIGKTKPEDSDEKFWYWRGDLGISKSEDYVSDKVSAANDKAVAENRKKKMSNILAFALANKSGSKAGKKLAGNVEKNTAGSPQITTMGAFELRKLAGRIYYHMKPADADKGAAMIECQMGVTTKFGAESKKKLKEKKEEREYPELPGEYEPDIDTKIGFMLEFSAWHGSTGGRKWAGGMLADVSIAASGGISTIGVKALISTDNTIKEGEVDLKKSAFAGMGCFTYAKENGKYTGDIFISVKNKGGEKPLCVTGKVGLTFLKGQGMTRFELGSRKVPIHVTPGCQGWGGGGWFNYFKKNGNHSTELGLLISFSGGKSKKWDRKFCKIEAYAKASAALAVFGKTDWDPLKVRELGAALGLKVKVGIDFSRASGGRWYQRCIWRDLNLEAYLGGDVTLYFDNSQYLEKLKANLSGRISLCGGAFSPSFHYSYTHKY